MRFGGISRAPGASIALWGRIGRTILKFHLPVPPHSMKCSNKGEWSHKETAWGGWSPKPHLESGEYLQARIERIQELLRANPGAFWPNQYANLNDGTRGDLRGWLFRGTVHGRGFSGADPGRRRGRRDFGGIVGSGPARLSRRQIERLRVLAPQGTGRGLSIPSHRAIRPTTSVLCIVPAAPWPIPGPRAR